jgi:amino acid transporter
MLQPSPDATPDAEVFFQSYLALPIVVFLYLLWKGISRDWTLYVPLHQVDLKTGVRLMEISDEPGPPRTWKNLPMRVVRSLF